jgi:hypothetical protein
MSGLRLLLFAFLFPSWAFAQGYINPPIFATAYVTVQPGGTVTTNLNNARNPPANINVINAGPITSWTINMPFPPFDGQIVTVACPGGNIGSITVADPTSSVQSGGITTCTINSGISSTYQFSMIAQQWNLLSTTGTTNAFPGASTNVHGSTFSGLDSLATPWTLYSLGADNGLLPALYVIKDVGTSVPFSAYNPLVVSPTIMIQTNIDASTTQLDWPLTVQTSVTNTDTGHCSAGGAPPRCEHVGINSTITHATTYVGAGNEGPSTWAFLAQSEDYSGIANPNYLQVGMEIDVGTLNVIGGSDNNGTRQAFTLVCNGSDTLSAGSFLVGTQYTITSLGASPNFTAIGAGSNTVGVVFTATGIGSGTGTATPTETTICSRGEVIQTSGGNNAFGTGLTLAGYFQRGIDLTSSTPSSCQLCLAEGTVSNAGITFGPYLNGGEIYSTATTAGQAVHFDNGHTYVEGNPTAPVSFFVQNNNAASGLYITASNYNSASATIEMVAFGNANTTDTTMSITSLDWSISGSGTATMTGYAVGATAGVSCSGSPTSSFASTFGIVTHC